MSRLMRFVALLFAAGSCLFPRPAQAQAQPAPELTPLELDPRALTDLLNTPLTVASLKGRLLRDSPGIITVISHDDIVALGARDLIDVLMTVPGFGFGVDVEGVVSLGFRGNWGQEGKILMLVDGMEMNESMYGSHALGNHFPVDAIQSIEIIRGPGSAIYGGHAELAVINITTRTAKDLNGAQVSGLYSRLGTTWGRANLTASAGISTPEGYALSETLFLGEANQSDKSYRDIYGGAFNMANVNVQRPLFADVGASYKNLHLRFIHDDYRTTNQDGFTSVLPSTALTPPGHKNFVSNYVEAHYDLAIGDRVKVTPLLSYRLQVPWQESNPSGAEFYDVTAERFTGKVTVTDQVTENLDVAAGVEARLEQGHANQRVADAFYAQDFGTFRTLDLFAEAGYDTWLGNFLAGGRYESHSVFGSAFVPRAAYTKVYKDFHFKLIASGAYRAPDLEALAETPNIAPERTRVYEGEVGYLFGDAAGANGKEGYTNSAITGSRGLESDWRLSFGWGTAAVSYSYYFSQNAVNPNIPFTQTCTYTNAVCNTPYLVPGHPEVALAFPSHKVSASANIHLHKHLSISPSATFMSERYGYTTNDQTAAQNPVVTALPAVLLLNVMLSYRDLGIAGLDATLGVHNLFDQSFSVPQPYASAHAPLPILPREVMLHLSYAFKL
jgi:outer membrane receptor protein involved in Fe transport